MTLDVIGIGGKAGSGKDTLARDVFIPRGYLQLSFAWPLKLAALAHGFDYHEIFHTKPPAARQWLQEYGVTKRDADPEYWVRQLQGLMRTISEANGLTKFVIPDVRFPNEAAFVKSLGGRLVRMVHGTNLPRVLSGAAAEHISETALDAYMLWDAIVRNDYCATGHRDRAAWLEVALPAHLLEDRAHG